VLPLVACGTESIRADTGPAPRDAGTAVSDANASSQHDGGLESDAEPTCSGRDVAGGEVRGTWCGVVGVHAPVRVPAGETLTIEAGSSVHIDEGTAITVEGTLRIVGTATARVTIGPAGATWGGIVVTGRLEAAFSDVRGAAPAIATMAPGTTVFTDGTIESAGTPISIAGEATFDRSRILGRSSIGITGGTLQMTDTSVDLSQPETGPDCTTFHGGAAILDHVHITGCHCPLHIQSTSAPVSVRASIFDGATTPVMIANTTGEFHGNVFEGRGTAMLDIGGGIDVDVADNWWGGPMADIGTRDRSQFRNADRVLTTRPTDVGPRM
jgi:hypothetical protein